MSENGATLRAIEELNQRGGRLLTIVDLMEAGTVSEEVAAYLLCAVSAGASFLTAALPGNAGKTTVLANLLTFLPPGTALSTLADPRALAQAESLPPDGRRCFLVHELGEAPIYSYLWGQDAVRYLGLCGDGRTIASCLHADTLEQMRDALQGRLGATEEAFRRASLLVFLHYRERPQGALRRVSAVYEAPPGRAHRPVFTWDPEDDAHRRVANPALPGCSEDRLGAAREFLRRLAAEDVRELAEVRHRVVAFLSGGR